MLYLWWRGRRKTWDGYCPWKKLERKIQAKRKSYKAWCKPSRWQVPANSTWGMKDLINDPDILRVLSILFFFLCPPISTRQFFEILTSNVMYFWIIEIIRVEMLWDMGHNKYLNTFPHHSLSSNLVTDGLFFNLTHPLLSPQNPTELCLPQPSSRPSLSSKPFCYSLSWPLRPLSSAKHSPLTIFLPDYKPASHNWQNPSLCFSQYFRREIPVCWYVAVVISLPLFFSFSLVVYWTWGKKNIF